MLQQFKYEQLHISAKKTKDKAIEILTTNNIKITAELLTLVYKLYLAPCENFTL